MNAVYRSADEAARLRWERVSVLRREELDSISGAPAAYGRRVGRIAAGLVLCGSAALLIFLALVDVSTSHSDQNEFNPDELQLTRVLVVSWPVALLVRFAARVMAERGCRARIEASLVPGADLYAAADRLERESVAEEIRAAFERLELASVALPLAGVMLLAPLSIHLPVAAFISKGALHYDGWMLMSMAVVGHAHFALVGCAIVFAYRVRDHIGLEYSNTLSLFGWKAWCIAIGVAALPGAILFLIPPILTAITGLLFIPASFSAVARAVLRERAAAGVRDDDALPAAS